MQSMKTRPQAYPIRFHRVDLFAFTNVVPGMVFLRIGDLTVDAVVTIDQLDTIKGAGLRLIPL